MRLTRQGWLAAFVIGGLVGVPQVANATLIGDLVDVEANVVGGPFNDSVIVTAGVEFVSNDLSNIGGGPPSVIAEVVHG